MRATRRQVLRRLSGWLLGCMAPVIGGSRALSAGISTRLLSTDVPALATVPIDHPVNEFVQDSATARAIGRAYLESTDAAGAKIRCLTRALDETASASRAVRVERVRQLRERDFETGNVVVIAGWVLAEIEAQLCALRVSGWESH